MTLVYSKPQSPVTYMESTQSIFLLFQPVQSDHLQVLLYILATHVTKVWSVHVAPLFLYILATHVTKVWGVHVAPLFLYILATHVTKV